MRSIKIRFRDAAVAVVIAAAVVGPAAVVSAAPASPATGNRSVHASERARDGSNTILPVTSTGDTSVWSDPSLIGNGGLKYG